MSDESKYEMGPREKNTTRRKLIKTGAVGATALSIPGFAAVKGKASTGRKPSTEDSDAKQTVEREVLETTPTYRIVRISVKGEMGLLKIYTTGEKEGTIATLDESSVPTLSTNDDTVGSLDLANSGWTDQVARYKTIDRSTYENCKDNSYGDHQFKGASIEFNVIGTALQSGTVQQILAEIFSQVGLGGVPFLDQALGVLAAWVVAQTTTGFTLGVADKDGWFNVKYISVRAARSYDADAFGGTQQISPPIPGFHIN